MIARMNNHVELMDLVVSHVLWVLFHSEDFLPLITNWRVVEAF